MIWEERRIAEGSVTGEEEDPGGRVRLRGDETEKILSGEALSHISIKTLPLG